MARSFAHCRREESRQISRMIKRGLSFLRLRNGSGVNPDHALPGYEDVWYYLWKERRLPVNVDPFHNKLANPEDRARLAKVFEQGMDKVVGYALPLRRDYYTDDTSELGQRRVVFPPRADVSDSRRFADGLSPAARFDPLGKGIRATLLVRTRPDGGSRAAARPRRAFQTDAATGGLGAREAPWGSWSRSSKAAMAASVASSAAITRGTAICRRPRENRTLDYPNRPVHRGPRRCPSRLHAAAEISRGLSRVGCGRRGHGS